MAEKKRTTTRRTRTAGVTATELAKMHHELYEQSWGPQITERSWDNIGSVARKRRVRIFAAMLRRFEITRRAEK